MAVRRLKGLYLKSEGKYLEDYPSCYVEQTEALFEWRQSTPKQDIELHKRAEKMKDAAQKTPRFCAVFSHIYQFFRCKKLENEIFQRHDLRARAVRVGAEH